MSIASKFNLVSGEYDKNRRKFVPCFDDFYIGTTKFITENISIPQKILDLGAGTGLLTKFWLEHFPDAEYILIDIAGEMLNVAKKRFEDVKNISYQVRDYLKDFPAEKFDAAISALSIHHLEDADKLKLFKEIYDALPPNGIFINYDQFCAKDSKINDWYNFYWRQQLKNSDLTANDLKLFEERAKFDKECSVEAEIEMLNRAGFQIAQCVYTCQKFSVIVAKKEGDYQIDDEKN